MWEFPSIKEFINSNVFQILWTLLIFAISAFAWISFILSIIRNTKESSGKFLKNIIGGSITLLLVILSSYELVTKYNETSKCRSLDLAKVKGVRVKKMNSEDSFGVSVITFNDEKRVQEGLKLLQSAYHRKRQKDKFIYGYELQLILEDSRYSEFYIHYFSETDKGGKADIIIPRCDTESNGGGVYSSPAFGDWIRENIEPQFKNQ